MGDLNHLSHDQNLLNSSTSNNIYENSMNKFPMSPIMNSSFDREDQFKNSMDLWKLEMDRKVRTRNDMTLLLLDVCFIENVSSSTVNFAVLITIFR